MIYKALQFYVCFVIVLVHHSSANQKENGNKNVLPSEESINHVSSVQKKGHVLLFHNAGTRSHLIAMNALVEGLVEHGHQVTSLTYAESKIDNPNYKEILVEDK